MSHAREGSAPARTREMELGAGASLAPEPVLLIIADISGYTRYMTANAKTLAHSQRIITELVAAIVKEVELPLEVAKLEGDAVFLYCRKQRAAEAWPAARRIIGEKLLTFFRLFEHKLAELSQSTTCSCHACSHIDQLRLKIIVHSGEALFHHVFHFLELAGLDVILVHRLLKNSVNADQYLLLTSAARDEVEFADPVPWVQGSESYSDLGCVETVVYVPGDEAKTQPASAAAGPTRGQRFARSVGLFWKLWSSPLVSWPEPHPHSFRNLESGVRPWRRWAFAAFTVVLTPLFLPAGVVGALLHSFPPRSSGGRPVPAHHHDPDGSCCKRV